MNNKQNLDHYTTTIACITEKTKELLYPTFVEVEYVAFTSHPHQPVCCMCAACSPHTGPLHTARGTTHAPICMRRACCLCLYSQQPLDPRVRVSSKPDRERPQSGHRPVHHSSLSLSLSLSLKTQVQIRPMPTHTLHGPHLHNNPLTLSSLLRIKRLIQNYYALGHRL